MCLDPLLEARVRPGGAGMTDGITLGRLSRVSAAPFMAASLLGAALIFLVQPMFARMATPLLGGAPAVWNVSLVCFQAALLAGYAYAHLLSRLSSGRLQMLIHAAVLVAGFACLPLRISDVMGEPDTTNPVFWLIGTFAISIAPPFAALSATAPLVQHWYAKSGLPDSADPYHLYAASNIGSLAGLAAYPLLIEPFAPLATQTGGWMAGYVLLAAVLLFAGWSVSALRIASPVLSAATENTDAPPITWTQRLMWLALSFAPSSLLVGVTSHITTDIAAAPFLWAPPLMIYLITFVLAFGKKPIPQEIVVALSPLAAALAMFMMLNTGHGVILLAMAADLLALFMLALACHGALNLRRPPAKHLTEFYLVMSLGGVLGGAFNALAAPLVFNNVFEYPLMLVGSVLLVSIGQPAKLRRITIYLLAAAGIALQAAIGFALSGRDAPAWLGFALLMPALAAIISSRRAPVGAVIALALAAPIGWLLAPSRASWSERSFFGVVKVMDEPGYRRLLHGTTMHGMQFTTGPDILRPLTYYASDTPIGQAFGLYSDAKSVGIVGLGIGSSACYSKPGQTWTFYEIDPLVVDVATDPRRFTYMSSCQPSARIELGDARIRLAQSSAHFDLLLLDAFSSDTVPTHLLTREAMDLYLDRIGENGVLVVHISNRHLALAPVVARVAGAAGVETLWQAYTPNEKKAETGSAPTHAVLVSRNDAALDRARASGLWKELDSDGRRPWTDDYSNIIGAMIDRIGRK
jgi:hypothetical protein